MQPRIDPLELLKCLSVLLSPSGGIRSANEVERVARLMSRYSKKLVSKCIYVQVLKSTSPDLLELFLKEGGWTLVVTWLQESMQTNNLPLVMEVLQLLQLCHMNADRLKEFDSSLIRRLATESADINVRTAASQVWSVWFPQSVDNSSNLQNLPLQNMHIPTPQADLGDNLPIPDDMALLNDLFDPSFTFPAQPSGGLDAETVFDLSSIDPSFTFENVTAQQYQPEPQTTSLPVIPPPVAPPPETTPPVVPEQPPQPPTGTLPVLKIVARGGKYSVTSEIESSSHVTAEMGENKSKEEKDKGKSEKGRSSGSQSSSSKNKDKHKDKSREKSKDVRKSSSTSSSSSGTQKDKEKDRKNDKHSRSSKDKDKSKHKSSSSGKSSSSKEEKPKEAKQAEKDKETLAALKAMTAPASDGLSKLAKIPKKPKADGEEVKILASDPNFDPLALLDKSKPKTVKTFNSKFRSTGLEEGASAATTGAKPTKKVGTGSEKKALAGLPAISATKRPPEMNLFASAEKKIKPAMLLEKKDDNLSKREEKGGIKLIAPRPRPAVLQDSSLFGDALDAGAKSGPRRKRRRSSDSKKEAPSASPSKKSPPSSSSPPPPPIESLPATDLPGNVSPVASPTVMKPQLKFYQDTLETQNAEEEKTKEDENLEMPVLTKETEDGAGEDKEGQIKDDAEAGEMEEGSTAATGEKGVLCITTQRTKPKKTLRWREDEDLLQFHYFELDETERVNVNKLQFGDMKQADRKYEREAVERARRMVTEDVMEEKMPWKQLAPLSLPHSEFVPGANSREKDIQEARESSTLQALFFNRQMLPDSPAEPDPEVPLERPTDPIVIPFDDVTGNPDSVYDLRHIPWPEPKTNRVGGLPGDGGYHHPPGNMTMDMAPPMIPTIPVAPVNPMDDAGAMHMMAPPNMARPGGGAPPMDAYAPPTGPPRGGGWMAGDGSVFPDTDNRYPPYDDGRGYGPPGRGGMILESDMGGAGNYGGGYDDMEMENRNFVHMNAGNMPMGPGRGMGMGMDGPRFRGGPGFGPNMGPRRPGPPMGGPPQGMGGPRGMSPGGVSACWHFMRGYCRMENKCKFLHPGYTG